MLSGLLIVKIIGKITARGGVLEVAAGERMISFSTNTCYIHIGLLLFVIRVNWSTMYEKYLLKI
jgi:hypothetical protein